MPEYRNHKQLCGGEIHAAKFSLKYLVIIINIGGGVNKLLALHDLCGSGRGVEKAGEMQIIFKFVLLEQLVLSDKQ